ncbi:hypothetical protein O181_001015 [Austropuccinia psidii MF-1]|uniref:Uncharacterized protein n=1 Tax=Austropuccinia psidii MF-1 TaxID=1389203 RepID=A0A9Q3B9W6_9BASI|nr:hypothetical protein [Austropuccinia psidii MF-1]
MSPVNLRNQQEYREGLSRTRRPGRAHFGHSGGWQDTEGNHTHPAIHLPIQQKSQTRGLYSRLLEERETRIRENKATNQAIEEQLSQKGPTLIPSGSQGVDQPNPPVASNHEGTSRSAAKSHNYSQCHVFSKRRQEYKGKNKTSFSQRWKELDPIIQKLL